MPARVVAPVLSLSLALVFARAPLSAQSQKSIIVSVLDKTDVPVTDVTAGDLAVHEDMEVREVTDVKPAADPMAVALLVDNTKAAVGQEVPTRELRAALTAFVQKLLKANPQNAIGIWEFAGAAVMTQKPTVNAADLTKKISRMFPSQQSGGVMLEALVDASRELSRKGAGPRRVIVSVSFNSAEVSTMLPQEVANAIRKAGVSFWALSIQSNGDAVGNSAGNAAARDVLMDRITVASGGAHLTGVTAISLESQMAKIADALTSQVVVTYARPAGAAASPQTIEAVSKKGMRVLTAPWVQ